MADWFQIRADLRATLMAIGSLPTQFAPENRKFDPVNGDPFVEEAMIPVQERPAATGTIEQQGIYQVTLVYPVQSGTKVPEDIIDDILAAFPPASSHGATVRVDRSERGRAFFDGPYYRLPVSIRWRAYSTY